MDDTDRFVAIIQNILARIINWPQILGPIGILLLAFGTKVLLKAILGEKHPLAKRVPLIFCGLAILAWVVESFPWTAGVGLVVGVGVIFFRKHFAPPPKGGGGGKSGGGSSTP